ncbi:MAG: ketoacyl-ACP synthase III [Chitinophagaceae bacterium]|nr:ketoacyl-ACP synthase III [Chitinophagaceae bacterium]
MASIFTGTGSYIPERIVTNAEFGKHSFFDESQKPLKQTGEMIVRKFKEITGIGERRYVTDDLHASDIGAIAARLALEDANLTGEELDQIIVAHNFGDVKSGTIQTDILPGLSARIKHLLRIQNPDCVAYDILFGCPGWLQGVIQAHIAIQAGVAKRCLVIGTETLSRVLDQNDRDSMIFADGAGASVIEATSDAAGSGILSYAVQSHTTDEAYYLFLGKSNLPDADPNVRYIKMKGRKIYEYALLNVPLAMKKCLDKANVHVSQLKKVLIHQANEKMDHAIIERLFQLYGINQLPEYIMPMSIHKLGNSSVATVITLFDLIRKGELNEHQLQNGDLVLMASVGAGMHINAVLYRI